MNGSNESLTTIVKRLTEAKLKDVEVVLGVPAPYIPLTSQLAKGSSIKIAGENSYTKSSGAFTGEVSPDMLLDTGATWVILGHSERRAIFEESSELIAEKVKFAVDKGLSVIFCCGESKEDRESGKTLDVVKAQLDPVIKSLTKADWSKVVVAYEPVWAIGTGLTATPQDAQDTHKDIRAYLAEQVSPEISEATRILYGGSVNAKTAPDLSKAVDIDGFLVGGASLKPEFVDIINV